MDEIKRYHFVIGILAGEMQITTGGFVCHQEIMERKRKLKVKYRHSLQLLLF